MTQKGGARHVRDELIFDEGATAYLQEQKKSLFCKLKQDNWILVGKPRPSMPCVTHKNSKRTTDLNTKANRLKRPLHNPRDLWLMTRKHDPRS